MTERVTRLANNSCCYEDPELFFQASQILDGDAVGQGVIERMIETAVNMMDVYLPAFRPVVDCRGYPEGLESEAWHQLGHEQAIGTDSLAE